MTLDNGCLLLEPIDMEMILSEVNNGFQLKDVFHNQLFCAGIDKADIFEIEAIAENLSPYENLIYQIIKLF